MSGVSVDKKNKYSLSHVTDRDMESLSDSTLGEIKEPDASVFRSLDQEEEAAKNFLEEPRLHAMVVLVSDQEGGERSTGDLVAELLLEENFQVDAVLHVESRKTAIRNALQTGVVGGADLIITIGGTGYGPRDRTPEATKGVLDRRIPGLSQALRASGLACNAVDAGLSRGISGISGSTVVVNLASSRAAIRDGMATLCPLVRWVVADMNKHNV